MTRVAAFDCGTNSLRLLIADIDGDSLTDVVRETRIVRLGQDVDATGEFAAEALTRTFAVCEEYAALVAEHGCDSARFVATSASRDVKNREAFFSGVESRLGLVPEVVSGTEEATLSFIGATRGLAGRPDVTGPFLVMDPGGGSTELVLGEEEVSAAYSMDVGCVRLTERHLESDPPEPPEILGALQEVDAWFGKATQAVDVSRARTLIGVAGTVTTLTAAYLGLDAYSREAIHGTEVPLDSLARVCSALLYMPRAERAELPYMHPGRVDVIGAGALEVSRLVELIDDMVHGASDEHVRFLTSESDILDGIAWSQAV